jgi:hypothetical protein
MNAAVSNVAERKGERECVLIAVLIEMLLRPEIKMH